MRHDVIQISVWHSLAMWCTLVETQAVEKGLQWHSAKLVNPLISFCSMFSWQNIISMYKLKHISFSSSILIIVYCRNAKSLLSLIWLQDVIGECQLQASFLNFANEVNGLSSSDMDDNESIVTTSPVENFSSQEESDYCSVGPRPSTPLESDVNRFFIKCISSFITDTLLWANRQCRWIIEGKTCFMASWKPYSSYTVWQAATHPKAVSSGIAQMYKDAGSNWSKQSAASGGPARLLQTFRYPKWIGKSFWNVECWADYPRGFTYLCRYWWPEVA